MRIVGGVWRGRPLVAPEGRGTRPTTDRVRESMASMVLAAFGLDLSEVDVLDAFAGSGALGLELLSRGGRSCTFVERDRRALGALRRNVSSLGATPEQARLQTGDVFSLAARAALAGGPFSLVLLDPPYATEASRVSRLLDDLLEGGQLAEGALLLYERAAQAGGLEGQGLQIVSEKAHGTTAMTLYRLAPPPMGD